MVRASHSPESDPREIFTVEVEAFLTELADVVGVDRDADAFALDVTTTRGSKKKLYLANAFAETRELHEQTGTDVFVATFQAFVEEDGRLKTLSIWPKGARTFLPRTDVVALLMPGAEPDADPEAVVEVPFEEIQDRLTQVPDLHPARFEVGEFPE